MENARIYDGLNRAYFGENCHEKEIVENLGELLRDGALFVDLGASLGQYTFHANQAMRGGRIIAVEADPIRVEELERNCQKWGADGRNAIDVLAYAICDDTGPQSFFCTYSNLSGGLFAREAPAGYHFEEIEVEGTSLDTLFPGEDPELIKIDVEGAELRVLRGATGMLSRGRSRFLIELHSFVDPKGQKSAAEVVAYLAEYGYHADNFHGCKLFSKS